MLGTLKFRTDSYDTAIVDRGSILLFGLQTDIERQITTPESVGAGLC
jgi:hypothetical protein